MALAAASISLFLNGLSHAQCPFSNEGRERASSGLDLLERPQENGESAHRHLGTGRALA